MTTNNDKRTALAITFGRITAEATINRRFTVADHYEHATLPEFLETVAEEYEGNVSDEEFSDLAYAANLAWELLDEETATMLRKKGN